MDRLYIPVVILHLSIVAKTLYCNDHTIRSLELLTAKTLLLHMLYYMNWLTHDFGLEQEGESLIAPMALAHPLHPIDRSRNRRQNLWVGWCVSSWWPLFPSRSAVFIYIYTYIYIYICILCMTSALVRIYTYNRSVIQNWWSCGPLHSTWLYFLGVRSSWVKCHFCILWFTNYVLLYDNILIPGCLWLLVFVLNNTLILGIWCSTIPHLPGCFCPWTFFQNIVFNMVPSDSFMSHLATQLGYSAGEFQALQLVVLVAFGVVD